MIVRPLTFLTGLLFAISGAYLFMVKHQSRALENQLEQVAETSRHDEQSIRVLQAQWALEADPSRIAALAAQFTGLQPMKPGQLVTLADLASTLPPPGSAAPFSNPEDEVPALPGSEAIPAPNGPAIEVQGHVATAIQAGHSVAPAAAPAKPAERVAEIAVPHEAAPAHADARAHPPAHHPVARLAREEAAPHHLSAPVREAAARPLASSLYQPGGSAIAPAAPAPRERQPVAAQRPSLPMGAQVVRVRATAQPAEPAPTAPLGGGSLLGMAQTGSQN
nr:hypothetical protein [uncultured Acidocella sp.]